MPAVRPAVDGPAAERSVEQVLGLTVEGMAMCDEEKAMKRDDPSIVVESLAQLTMNSKTVTRPSPELTQHILSNSVPYHFPTTFTTQLQRAMQENNTQSTYCSGARYQPGPGEEIILHHAAIRDYTAGTGVQVGVIDMWLECEQAIKPLLRRNHRNASVKNIVNVQKRKLQPTGETFAEMMDEDEAWFLCAH
ncbi:hypothetical protein BDW59DRAFT_161207 [Aspergillus cavernicola]|uniref:Uncharacterized protein n=1 Tax=Aspergillus cavernicola TaxID=176166 RepID=A0ABR4IED9_9EURO